MADRQTIDEELNHALERGVVTPRQHRKLGLQFMVWSVRHQRLSLENQRDILRYERAKVVLWVGLFVLMVYIAIHIGITA